MKKLLNYITTKLSKIGVDKYIHATVGGFMAAIIFNIFICFCGFETAMCLSFAMVMIAEICKEYLIDDAPDKLDIAATAVGVLLFLFPILISY